MENSKNEGSGLPPAPEAKAPAPAAKKQIQVISTQPGYYDHRRIEAGTKFNLKNDQEFSMNWMKDLSGRLPTKEMLEKVEKKKSKI